MKPRHIASIAAAAGALFLAGAASVQAVPYTYSTLDYAGADHNFVTDINNTGQMVGFAANVPSAGRNSLGWFYDGSVFTTTTPNVPWYCGPIPGGPSGSANTINNLGVVGGQYEQTCSTPRYGYLWNAGSYTLPTYSLPPNSSTTIDGLNDAGVFVGSSYIGGPNYRGYVNNGGTVTMLDAPGATSTNANGINNTGTIVGSYVLGGTHAYMNIGGVYTTIDVPGGTATIATDINNNGRIVGFYYDTLNVAHGFTWDNGVFETINAPLSASHTVADGINDLGVVVGHYYDANNVRHGFVATPEATVPAPATLTLVCLGLLGLGWSRRRIA